MEKYNKIMQIFWLTIGIVILIFITYKGITEGFDRWAVYYIFAVMALFVFLIRNFLMRRMKKHNQYLEDKQQKKKK